MFQYSDPVASDTLAQQGALEAYRSLVHVFYRFFSRLPLSAFTQLDAFDGVASAQTGTVSWIGFPRTAQATNAIIDAQRFVLQDKYVEWHVNRNVNPVTITFTTEFPEYYEALAMVGEAALVQGIGDIYPAAMPTTAELFGPNFNPAGASPDVRGATFVDRLTRQRNPWNTGDKGIICLGQGANTLAALFNLVGRCGVPQPSIPASATCSSVGDACGPNRNSDPKVCTFCQERVRARDGMALADPAGIVIERLGAIWKFNGRQIDINDPATNFGAWRIQRNGRRAELKLIPGLTMGDDAIETGAQVSTVLSVGASITFAPDDELPPWARLGQESSRQIV